MYFYHRIIRGFRTLDLENKMCFCGSLTYPALSDIHAAFAHLDQNLHFFRIRITFRSDHVFSWSIERFPYQSLVSRSSLSNMRPQMEGYASLPEYRTAAFDRNNTDGPANVGSAYQIISQAIFASMDQQSDKPSLAYPSFTPEMAFHRPS